MPYQPILATLGYVLNEDGSEVLMVHRTKRSDDAHLGKFNGLGGKIEPSEHVADGMRRELFEEAGLIPRVMRLAGTISWPGFGADGEDWFGFVFRIESFEGRPPEENPEGALSWVSIDTVLDLPLWEGDRFFLPLVFANPLRQFHGVMPYEGGKPLGWDYSFLTD